MTTAANILNISCPHCHTTNRVPDARLSQQPKCGKCKQTLFAGAPMILDQANAARVIGKTDIPVLVDCWADWCGPCKSFAPTFAAAARELEPRLRFAKCDTQANEQLAAQWGIRSIPTLILFHHGREKARVSGDLPLNQLKAWLVEQGV